MSSLSTASSLSNNSTRGDNNYGHYDDYNDYYFDWYTESYLPTVVYLTLYDVVAFFGVIGNVMILVVMRHQSLSSLSYSVYLRFLAVSDLVVIVFRVVEVNLDRFHNIYQKMVTWSVRFCQSFMFFQYWSVFLSLWLVVAITCDRFIAVAFPLKWKMSSTKSKAFITCMTFALLTLLFNLSVFYTVDTVPDEYDSSILYCSFRTDIRIIADSVTFVFGSVLPIVLIFLLNMLILHQIRLSRRHRDHLTEGNKTAVETAKGKAPEAAETPGTSSQGPHCYIKPEDGLKEGTASMSTEAEVVVFASTQEESLHVSKAGKEREIFMSSESASLSNLLREDDAKNCDDAKSCRSVEEDECDNAATDKETSIAEDQKDEKLHDFTTKYQETSDNVAAGNEASGVSSATSHRDANETYKKGNKSVKLVAGSPQRSNSLKPHIEKRADQKKKERQVKKVARVDRATVSLTYISVSALLTMAPYGVMHGLFMVFLDQWDALLVHDPWAPVPLHLQNLIRVWDVLELVMLFNFCQNFYILLLTNGLVCRALMNTLGFKTKTTTSSAKPR